MTFDQHLRAKIHSWLDYHEQVGDMALQGSAAEVDVVMFAQQLHAMDPREIGDVTIVTNEAGECVAVTRTDGYGKTFSVIWEKK